MTAAAGVTLAVAVHELHRSLVSAREQALDQLRLIEDIERLHGGLPLAALVDLARRHVAEREPAAPAGAPR